MAVPGSIGDLSLRVLAQLCSHIGQWSATRSLQRVPISGIEEGLNACSGRVHRRVDRGILARLGMAIGEHGDSNAGVPIRLDTLVAALGGEWPPTIRAPTGRGVYVPGRWHAIANHERIRRVTKDRKS